MKDHGPTKISQREFALAIDLIQQRLEATNEREEELKLRIVIAVDFMVSHTPDAPDDVRAYWEKEGPGSVIAGMSNWGRKNLKKIAEDMKFDAVPIN